MGRMSFQGCGLLTLAKIDGFMVIVQAGSSCAFCLGLIAVGCSLPEAKTNSNTIIEARCVLGPGPRALGMFT